MDGLGDQITTSTTAMPTEDSEGLQDMWNEPPEISRDAWAVTRCLSDHGNSLTKWTAGHFVAIAMWSGGLEAGIQAAKAIRIFGIWSPHADNSNDGPLPLSHVATNKELLDKLWPEEPNRQRECLAWATRSNPGTPLPDFETAHRHLLHECVGLDLTKFPTVVRPRLKPSGRGGSLAWGRLVTIEQFWETLASVLRKHFAPEVDLDSIAQHIQPAALSHSVHALPGIKGDFGKRRKAKSGGRYGPSCGKHKETNMAQADDYQDDAEDFGQGPEGLFKTKVEPALLKSEINPDRERLDVNTGTKTLSPVVARTFRFRPFIPGSSAQTRKYASPYRPANVGAVRPFTSSSPTIEQPQPVYDQVVNLLYEQSCGVTVDRITSFRTSPKIRLALPQAWKEICDYRTSNGMPTCGVEDRLPRPRVSLVATSGSNIAPKPYVGNLKSDLDPILRQNAKDDLEKFDKFCLLVIVID